MTTKTPPAHTGFSAKNNCIRAARKELGAEAQPGVDFELHFDSAFEKPHRWTPIDPAVRQVREHLAQSPERAEIEDAAEHERAIEQAHGEEPAEHDHTPDAAAVTAAFAEEPAPAAPVSLGLEDLSTFGHRPLMPIFLDLNEKLSATEDEAEMVRATMAALVAAYDAGQAKPKRERKERAPRAEGPSKQEIVGQLLLRPEGCTAAEALAATGWTAISMPQQATANGLELRKEGKPARYYGSRPATA